MAKLLQWAVLSADNATCDGLQPASVQKNDYGRKRRNTQSSDYVEWKVYPAEDPCQPAKKAEYCQ